MTKDEYFNRMADFALLGIDCPDAAIAERLRYQVIHMLKEVERDARHTACDHINAAANAVQNQTYPEPR